MPELAPLAVAFAAAVVLGAYIVRGMSGFGTSLVAIPLLVFIMPIHSAVPLMSLLGLGAMLMLGVRDRGHVRWDEMWRLLGPTLLGVLAGVYVFSLLEARLMQKLLGAFIATYAAYMVLAQFLRPPSGQCSTRWAYPAGFAGSVVDSMFGGGGGLLVVIYMHRRGYAMVAFRATLAVLWLLELIVRVGGYAVSGFYDARLLWLALLLAPAMFVGNALGERITRTMSQQAFTRVLAVVLMAAAVNLLLK
jgi:uncharacterized membrane protein YfcA